MFEDNKRDRKGDDLSRRAVGGGWGRKSVFLQITGTVYIETLVPSLEAGLVDRRYAEANILENVWNRSE